MDRREFLIGSVATLVASPRVVRAQPAQRLPKVALYGPNSPDEMTERGAVVWSAFLGELHRLGHIEGQTIAIERWSRRGLADNEIAPLARKIVESNPSVVMSVGAPSILSMSDVTSDVPVVGMGTFPPELHTNLARSSRNITGFDLTGGGAVYGKALQHLHDSVPSARIVAVVTPVDDWNDPVRGGVIRQSAEALGVSLVPALMDRPITESSIRAAFSIISSRDVDAIYVTSNSVVAVFRHTVAELVRDLRLPAASTRRVLTEAGLLMSFDTNRPDLMRRAAGYVDRILQGESVDVLPIQNPTLFDFVINLRAARELDISLPPASLLAATEIIE